MNTDKEFNGIAFVHIPKTAGTSFRHQLHDGLGAVYLDYQSENPVFIPEQSLTPEEAMCSGDYFGISGHVSASRYLASARKNNWALVTFIRDPLERACSHYAFLVETAWRGLDKNQLSLEFLREKPSFVEWLDNPKWKSRSYSKAIDVGAEEFDFIGTAENYQSSLGDFNSRFGTNIRATKENVSSFTYRPSIKELEQANSLLRKEKELYQLCLRHVKEYAKAVPN